MLTRAASRGARDESGVVTVLFAIVLGLMLVIGSLVITIGSWFTHARQLQTKADAAVFAGGNSWSFPCTPEADARILDAAREYVGAHTGANGSLSLGGWNEQIGGVGADQLYVAINQANPWNDGFSGADLTDPPGPVCQSKTLDVKITERDSPLLWGWLPFHPDIKRKARVQLEEAPGRGGVLPIGVRVPRPVSSAAVLYDEGDGTLLAVRFLERKPGIVGLPGGLEGYSTLDDLDTATWTSIPPPLPRRIGVAIALSFRPTCDTPDVEGPCFSDAGFTKVNAFCNQGLGTQIVKCYQATGNWPAQSVQGGLHFIRGYPEGTAGSGPPQLRAAYLDNAGCESSGYFNSTPASCQARLSVSVDLGSVMERPAGAGGGGDDDDDGGGGRQQTRKAGNVQVRYRLVRSDGSTYCDYGASCDLLASDANAEGTVTYSTQGHGDSLNPALLASARGHAIAIQIHVKKSSVTPNPGNCGVGLQDFNDNCRWFYTGAGLFGTSTPPNDGQILASPVQRAFMGDLDVSGPLKWLQVQRDDNCDGISDNASATDGRAATQRIDRVGCFAVDIGLKGGLARDQDEPPFVFNEGTGPSQMGSVDCDPAIPEGQVLIDGTLNGCKPFFTQNSFSTSPLCPDSGQFFTFPKAAPFDDWPPIDCVKTRTTGSMNQLISGLNLRIFGRENNPRCPDEVDRDGDGQPDFTRGRNYWHRANNLYDGSNFAWDLDTIAPGDDLTNRLQLDDPRLVTFFFTPYDSFTGSGQETFPIVALGSFYVTGYGRLNGSGGFQGGRPDDPCSDGNNGDLYDGTGNEPPPDLREATGNSSGVAVWGHFLKIVIPASSSTGGSGDPCDPDDSFQACVAVLVE